MRYLSGIQPSGTLHLVNYFGAMKRHIERQQDNECFYFIAEYHALTTVRNPEELQKNILNVALDYLALGLDPDRTVFFRQSCVPEVVELTWVLSTLTPMGLLERAHSYKDKIANFIHWYEGRGPMYYLSDEDLESDEVMAFVEQWRGGYGGKLPDEAPTILESRKKVPSWRRVCKMLLRNDYWAKGLGFSQQQSGSAHQQYKRLMAKRRQEWGIFPPSG